MYKDAQSFLTEIIGMEPPPNLVLSGDSTIYQKRLTNPEFPRFAGTPHILFFYYLRIDMDGRLRVDHYRYVDGDVLDPATWQPIEYSESNLREIVTRLAKNARPGGPRPKRPPRDRDVNFENLEWNRKCYVAIYIEEANWKFHKFPVDNSAIMFVTTTQDGTVPAPNFSFFDAIDFEIEMPITRPRRNGPTSDSRSAIVFVNHLKRDAEGNALGGDNGEPEEQKFEFKMFVKVNFSQGDSAPMTVIFDPGGTNMGPPVPPP